MNRLTQLSGVVWDRCSLGSESNSAFGWIPRTDGQRDFLILCWHAKNALNPSSGNIEEMIAYGFATSSAKYTREFSKHLFGTDAGHNDCQRIDDVFGTDVQSQVVSNQTHQSQFDCKHPSISGDTFCCTSCGKSLSEIERGMLSLHQARRK